MVDRLRRNGGRSVNKHFPSEPLSPEQLEAALRAVGPERELFIEFTVLLTAKTMHALFGPSRRKWIAL